MTKTKETVRRKPRILITSRDLETLQTLLDYSPGRRPAMDLLEAELDRAVIVGERYSSKPFGRIGSWVTYEDLATGQARNVQLVLPVDADIDNRRISILTPVGASLLGLSPGAEFEWTDEKGRPHRLRLVDVVNAQDPVTG